MGILRSIPKAIGRSPFVILVRSFFAQFFASETVTSEIQLRQTIIWVLAFLLMPGLFLAFEVLPAYRFTLLRAPEMAARIVIMLGSVFVTYSMVIVGFIGVFVWDSLTFDRRDAMVLGPLPMRGATIITAKLAALAGFLVGTAGLVNLITAVPFALAVGDHLGAAGLIRHFTACMAATLGAATFTFGSIVIVRGAVVLLGGARLAAALGSTLQFLFVSALLCVVIVVPAVSPSRIKQLDSGTAAWFPPAWFLGAFQQLLGSVNPDYAMLARRAVLATTSVFLGAVIVSILGFRRQTQLALAPAASAGILGGARFRRMLAHLLVRGNPVAKAASDFILLTIARNRAQQAPIAINAAVGAAIIVAALSRSVTDLDALMRPRTAVLWIPLVLAYWTTIGLRAAFFVPSELAASWSFRANAPESGQTYWTAVRASMLAYIVPRTLMLTAALAPLVGWRVAAWHTVIVCALVVLLVQVVAATIDFIPFTRAYVPGHAKLRSRWPIYLLGMYAVAYWPVQWELRILHNPAGLVAMVAVLAIATGGFDLVVRRTARKRQMPLQEESEDPFPDVTLLNLGGYRVPSS